MGEQTQSSVMPLERDDENGRYRESYSESLVFQTIEESSGLTTKEVADEIGSSRRLALRKLRSLEADERVHAREVGNTFLWTVQDD